MRFIPLRLAPLTVLVLAAAACAPSTPPPRPPPPPPAEIPPVAPVAAVLEAPAPQPPPPASLAERELTAHDALFAALRARDARALAAQFANQTLVDVGPGVAQARTPAAAAALAETLWLAFPDAKLQWGTLLQSGDALAVEVGWTGTQTGRLGDVAATNRVVGAHALLVERFDAAGLIVSLRVYVAADLR